MDTESVELAEKALLEQFFKLSKEELELSRAGKEDAKLSSRLDSIQNALIRIRADKQKLNE